MNEGDACQNDPLACPSGTSCQVSVKEKKKGYEYDYKIVETMICLNMRGFVSCAMLAFSFFYFISFYLFIFIFL